MPRCECGNLTTGKSCVTCLVNGSANDRLTDEKMLGSMPQQTVKPEEIDQAWAKIQAWEQEQQHRAATETTFLPLGPDCPADWHDDEDNDSWFDEPTIVAAIPAAPHADLEFALAQIRDRDRSIDKMLLEHATRLGQLETLVKGQAGQLCHLEVEFDSLNWWYRKLGVIAVALWGAGTLMTATAIVLSFIRGGE